MLARSLIVPIIATLTMVICSLGCTGELAPEEIAGLPKIEACHNLLYLKTRLLFQ